MARKPKAPNNLFATLDNINTKKPLIGGYDKRQASGYMLLMWLSHCPDIIHIVNKINEVQFKIPSSVQNEVIYKALYDLVPKKKRFVKWVKKVKDEARDKKIEEIMTKYGFSKREAMYYID